MKIYCPSSYKEKNFKLLAIKYAYSLIVLCGISFMACSR